MEKKPDQSLPQIDFSQIGIVATTKSTFAGAATIKSRFLTAKRSPAHSSIRDSGYNTKAISHKPYFSWAMGDLVPLCSFRISLAAVGTKQTKILHNA